MLGTPRKTNIAPGHGPFKVKADPNGSMLVFRGCMFPEMSAP